MEKDRIESLMDQIDLHCTKWGSGNYPYLDRPKVRIILEDFQAEVQSGAVDEYTELIAYLQTNSKTTRTGPDKFF